MPPSGRSAHMGSTTAIEWDNKRMKALKRTRIKYRFHLHVCVCVCAYLPIYTHTHTSREGARVYRHRRNQKSIIPTRPRIFYTNTHTHHTPILLCFLYAFLSCPSSDVMEAAPWFCSTDPQPRFLLLLFLFLTFLFSSSSFFISFPSIYYYFFPFFFLLRPNCDFSNFFFTCLGRQLGNDGAKLNNMIQNKADILFFFCSWHKNFIEKNASLFLPMRHCWVIDLLFPPRSRLPVETGSRQSLFIVEGTGESFLLSFPSIEQKRWRHCILSTCCG